MDLLRITFIFCFSIGLLAAGQVPDTDADVIVIGRGPGGLSAVSALCRVARRVISFDSREYRNGPTRNMHDVIGNDGTPPADFRLAASKQIMKYENVTLADVKVHDVWKSTTRDGFDIFYARTERGDIFTARRVILATGVTDLLPSTPGVREAFGKGLFWCPWCDGYEHRDQPLAVLGPLSDALSSAVEMHNMNPDIIVLANGTDTLAQRKIATERSPTWEQQFKAYNIPIVNATIASIERLPNGKATETLLEDSVQKEIGVSNDRSGPNGKHYDRFRVHFDNKLHVDRAAFLINVEVRQTSHLVEQLKLAMDGSKVKVNPKMQTNMTGVYAVGDMNNDGSTNVPHAMFTGKKAAVVVHVDMAKEESKASITKRAFIPDRLEEKLTMRQIGNELEQLWATLQA